jgi:four helix bundle protein
LDYKLDKWAAKGKVDRRNERKKRKERTTSGSGCLELYASLGLGLFELTPVDSKNDARRMMPYEKFKAWRVSHELAPEVYRVTERWPKSERYQLTAQTRRAALSAPTNIAEGAAKRGTREFRRYLDITLGSLSELSYLLRFSKDLGGA